MTPLTRIRTVCHDAGTTLPQALAGGLFVYAALFALWWL